MEPQPGWYEAGRGPIRWWSGRGWTAFVIRGDRPRTETWVIEQPVLAWVSGGFFAVAGLAQLASAAIGGVAPTQLGLGIVYLALAALWFVMAVRSGPVVRMPRPTGPALDISSAGPLPGTEDDAPAGPPAGWYETSRDVRRWWTGSRWAPYIAAARYGVRPTAFAGRTRVLAYALGGVMIAAGIVLGAAFFPVIEWWAVGVGGVMVAVGALVMGLYLRTARRLELPSEPPAGAPAPDSAHDPTP